jgi:hypothetical protein
MAILNVITLGEIEPLESWSHGVMEGWSIENAPLHRSTRGITDPDEAEYCVDTGRGLVAVKKKPD